MNLLCLYQYRCPFRYQYLFPFQCRFLFLLQCPFRFRYQCPQLGILALEDNFP